MHTRFARFVATICKAVAKGACRKVFATCAWSARVAAAHVLLVLEGPNMLKCCRTVGHNLVI